jgi:hypothetical protein
MDAGGTVAAGRRALDLVPLLLLYLVVCASGPMVPLQWICASGTLCVLGISSLSIAATSYLPWAKGSRTNLGTVCVPSAGQGGDAADSRRCSLRFISHHPTHTVLYAWPGRDVVLRFPVEGRLLCDVLRTPPCLMAPTLLVHDGWDVAAWTVRRTGGARTVGRG